MMNTPKTRRGAETKEKILRAAEQSFSEKGFFQTVIADITGLANIAPGTFYIYFEDKISVFRFLMDDLGHRLRTRIHVALEGSSSRLEIEERGVREFFSFVAEHKGLFRIIWDAQFVDQAAFKAYYEGFASAYARRLGEAKDAGEVRDLDLQALSYSLIGINNFVALKYIIFDGGDVPESAIKTVVSLLSSGAFAEAARP
jgi:AcrR family transcriptional regulator